MNKAELINHSSHFEVILNDISLSDTISSEEFVVEKSGIIELIKVKPLNPSGDFPENQCSLKWLYPYGKMFETNAGIVSRGTDNGITTWFTDDGTPTGEPDSEKLYLWAKQMLLQ